MHSHQGKEADPDLQTDRDKQIVALAREQHERDGEIEFDDPVIVSEGEDNGAYVQAWIWVDFSGTPLDKSEEIAQERMELKLEAYERLHDGLSDMIEGGRLTEADIPDDYRWLRESLEKIGGMS